LKIAELFYSIQGEGSLVGVPSVFIRTSGCNLRCAWCDTPYTSWQPEGTDLDLAQILDEVAAHPTRHVVVTGGEPMIAPDIIALTGRLRQRGMHMRVVRQQGNPCAPGDDVYGMAALRKRARQRRGQEQVAKIGLPSSLGGTGRSWMSGPSQRRMRVVHLGSFPRPFNDWVGGR